MGSMGGEYAQAFGSLYGGIQQRKQDKELYNDQKRRQEALLAEMRPIRDYNVREGQANQGAAANFYREGMNNPRQQVQPELNRLAAQYRGTFNAARSLYARGNPMGGPSGAANMPFQLAGEQAGLTANARNQLAGALANIGGNQMSAGLGSFGMSAGVQNSMFDQSMQYRNARMQNDLMMGQNLWSAFNQPQRQQAAYQPMGMPPTSNNNSLTSAYGNIETLPTVSRYGSGFYGSKP